MDIEKDLDLVPINQHVAAELQRQNEKLQIKTNFQFLKAHNGLRKGKVHTFLGVTSGGKSTLMRSIIFELGFALRNDGKVLIWLSEESKEDFCVEMQLSGIPKEIYDQYMIISEMNFKAMSFFDHGKFEKTLEKVIIGKNVKAMIFDNLTTSRFYEGASLSDQAKFGNTLKKIAATTNIPMLLVAHTGADVTDNYKGVIQSNNIRGSKNIVNTSEFFYILQRFISGKFIVATLRVTKHRGQDVKDKIYTLKYNQQMRMYEGDNIISFSDFKNNHQQRDTF